MRWNPDDWFGEVNPITIGAEVELILFDSTTNSVLQENQRHRANKVFESLPNNIWKDYYPWQLEIRSDPFNSPDKVISQLLSFYKMADEAFKKENLYVIPSPYLGLKNENSYCGMHVHVKYVNDALNQQFYERAWSAYPFILAIADHTKNSENEETFSRRLTNSHHVGIPYLNRDDFSVGTGNMRYKDITINRLKTGNDGENPRNRIKTVATLETRIFDTPSLGSHLRFITESVYNIFSKLKVNNFFVSNNNKYNVIKMTRDLSINQSYGFNKILHESNSNVCEDLCELFKIQFPRTTQFEFRRQFHNLNYIDRHLIMRKYAWPFTMESI